jgi:hypothetical protein
VKHGIERVNIDYLVGGEAVLRCDEMYGPDAPECWLHDPIFSLAGSEYPEDAGASPLWDIVFDHVVVALAGDTDLVHYLAGCVARHLGHDL